VGDLARLLGLPTEEAARKFVDRHQVPHAKVGRSMFVLLDSLISYLKAREALTDPTAAPRPSQDHADALHAAAGVVRRRGRQNLRDAAHRLAGKVAETPKD
jgi:hypothetical protein